MLALRSRTHTERDHLPGARAALARAIMTSRQHCLSPKVHNTAYSSTGSSHFTTHRKLIQRVYNNPYNEGVQGVVVGYKDAPVPRGCAGHNAGCRRPAAHAPHPPTLTRSPQAPRKRFGSSVPGSRQTDISVSPPRSQNTDSVYRDYISTDIVLPTVFG